jgi:hypothetical protein
MASDIPAAGQAEHDSQSGQAMPHLQHERHSAPFTWGATRKTNRGIPQHQYATKVSATLPARSSSQSPCGSVGQPIISAPQNSAAYLENATKCIKCIDITKYMFNGHIADFARLRLALCLSPKDRTK